MGKNIEYITIPQILSSEVSWNTKFSGFFPPKNVFSIDLRDLFTSQ